VLFIQRKLNDGFYRHEEEKDFDLFKLILVTLTSSDRSALIDRSSLGNSRDNRGGEPGSLGEDGDT